MKKTATQKITLISLILPVLFGIYYFVDVVRQISIHGVLGVYDCGIAFPLNCSLLEYIFTTLSFFAYAGISVIAFVVVFVILNYILFQIRLYKNARYNLFWILILLMLGVIIYISYLINYLMWRY